MTDFNGAFVPTARLRRLLDAAERGHRLITTAQNALLHALPSVGITALLAATASQHAFEAGLAMLLVQQTALRVAAWRESDAVEWGGILAGGAAAIAIVASAAPVNITTLIAAAALTCLLAFWPNAFHAWRGSLVTDFERLRDGCAFPAMLDPPPD
jgi:hypothetical protein